MSKLSKERFEKLVQEMMHELADRYRNLQELPPDDLCNDILDSETFDILMRHTIMINLVLCPGLLKIPPEIVKSMMGTIAVAAFQLGKRVGQTELTDETLEKLQ